MGASRAPTFDDLRKRLQSLAAAPLVSVGRGAWIYGAGGFGKTIRATLEGAGLDVLGFIDRKSTGRTELDGKPCVHPDALTDADARGAVYVHGLLNHYFSSREIVDWAAGRPFAGLLFASDINRIAGVAIRNYWLAPAHETLSDLDAIGRALDAFDDDASRTLFADLLTYRLHNDPRLHPQVTKADMYAPDFLPVRGRKITLVDGGAYDGDTVESLLSQGIEVGDWIAFEPDARNIEGLRATADRLAPSIGDISLFPYGLSDRNGTVGFADSEGEASHVVENPGPDFRGSTIAVARLDDVVRRSRPVYIKLDIEGAETSALAGMPHMIRSENIFAVSVYHRPADLWRIPLFFRDRLPGSKLRLRQHGHHAFDTVLYVYPG